MTVMLLRSIKNTLAHSQIPHFSYHLQIFYVDDITETAKVEKYCLWFFKFYFLNLACFHIIFLIKCVYSVPKLQFWVKELVVAALHLITKLAKTMT